MSHWDSAAQTIVRWPTNAIDGYPGWLSVDCGCCAGVQWGGDYPRECPHCQGSGVLALHVASRRIALYPGGPLCGSWPDTEVQRVVAA